VRVFKDGSSPVLRIFCHDYRGGTRTFMEQLVVARNEMEADREDRMQILSVIPIEALCGMICFSVRSKFSIILIQISIISYGKLPFNAHLN